MKTVCTFIGAQAMVDTERHGGRNPLVDAAQHLDITGGRDEAERELDAIRGPKVADRWEDDSRLSGKVQADPQRGVEAANAEGSFEAMLRLMGGGPKPAMPGINGHAEGGEG